MRFWFDITNTPQVHFLLGIRNILQELGYTDFIFTAREFSETAKLLAQQPDIDFKVVGTHAGKSKLKKGAGLIGRFFDIHKLDIQYDVSMSCGSESAIWSSWLKRKKSIAFGDNDTAQQWTYGYFVNHAFFPDAIPRPRLEKQGLRRKLTLYRGFKEDIYLAYFTPAADFTLSLPFSQYVVVRPENIQARYIRNGDVVSIVPELLNNLVGQGYNILYLPRYEFDKAYADGLKNIYIPDSPVNGLDACYHADAVLTGAGTIAREAACLGVPSISFYAGKQLLAVDQKMIQDGLMFHSRDVERIIKYLKNVEKKKTARVRAQKVKEEIQTRLYQLFNEW